MRAIVTAIVVLCWTTIAFAEGGELYTTADFGFELARLKYERPGFDGGAGYSRETRLLPRFGGALLYGISDNIRLGLRISHAWSGNTRYDGVTVDTQAGNFYFNYRDTSLGFVAAYQWDWGYEWAMTGSLEAGPSWVTFNDLALIEPSSNGRLPLDAQHPGGTTYYAGARLMAHWRPNNWFVLEGGPEVQIRGLPSGTGNGTNVFYGIVISPAFNMPVGPSLTGP